jgi:putative transposase
VAQVHRTLKLRLDPNAEQAALLAQFAGARRWVWNWALELRNRTYKETGRSTSWADVSKQLTALKREPQTAWLCEMDSQALQQALSDLQAAFARFFAGEAGFPQWRSKHRQRATFRIPQRIGVGEHRIRIPKIGDVVVLNPPARHVEGVTKGATFRQSASGKWYATVTVEVEVWEGPLPLPGPDARVVGVDLGLMTYAVLSDGTSEPNPRFGRVADRKLRRAHRGLSRKARGSANRRKARVRLALLYERVGRRRLDFAHKLTTGWLETYDGVCIEDLGVSGLARTKLARSVLDAAWGEIKRQMAYKAPARGKYLGYAGRFEASTKVCSACLGRAPAGMTLSDRSWTCPHCGADHDRDENAAQMVRWLGYGRYLAASGRQHVAGEGTRTRETLVEAA